jgi:lipoprotein signal peptidase
MIDRTRVRSVAPGGVAATWTGPGQRTIVVGVLAAVVVLDQATKWWAWRNASGAIINAASTWPIGRPVSSWFAGPVTGAILDLLSVGLLSLAGHLLVRRRRRGVVLVAGALMIGGWSSNLLDRLGLHGATAPGSVRGAIDFIHLGPPYWNLADFVIIGAAALFLVAAFARGGRRALGAAPTGHTPPVTGRRPRAQSAAAGLVLAVVVGGAAVHGAVHDDGVYSSPRASTHAAGEG